MDKAGNPTTDLGVDDITLEPVPMDEEIGFILTNAAKYLSKTPTRSDILSVYAGLRPLVKVGDARSAAALSRDHTILISNAGLLTIAGGKWTTYRKMAQDAVEQAETMAGLALELKQDGDRQKQTVKNFKKVAQGYLPPA